MQDRHEARGDVRLVVARGQPDVVRHAAAERMGAAVKTAVLEVEAERRHQSLAKRLLPGRGKVAPERQRLDLATEDALEKLRQELGERREQRVDLSGRDAGLVAVEERIVGRETECLALRRRLLAGEPHHLLERRAEQSEVGLLARLAPEHLGLRGGAHEGRDQLRGHRGGAPIAAAHLAQIGRLPCVQLAWSRLGLIEEIAGLGADQQLMDDLAQRRHLLGADRVAAPRHHDLMVPLQDSERAAQMRDARKPRLKRAIGRHGLDCHEFPGSLRTARHIRSDSTPKVSTPNA